MNDTTQNDPAQNASNTLAAIFGNILAGIERTVDAAVVRNTPAPTPAPAPAPAPSFFSTAGGMVVGVVAVVVLVAYLKKSNS